VANYSACLVMFSSIPTHSSVTNNDDPPYETSGSGIPLVGIMPSTTLMLMKACSTTMLVMPTAQRDHKHGADQAQFLGSDGENKIGMRLGKIKKFLLTLHQAGAGHTSGTHRNQRLNNVEAGLLAVGVRIEECENAGAPKGDVKNQEIQRQQRRREGIREITHAHPGYIKDARRNRRAGNGCTQIRLQHD
jgi:hypothetical protein